MKVPFSHGFSINVTQNFSDGNIAVSNIKSFSEELLLMSDLL